ncbi:MAG: exodeoxyribonuclease III [Gammaproteobacteria bacterium]
MKIASWNVNSIRVRQQHVLDWLAQQQPDVLGLQELKMPTEDFAGAVFREAGYHSVAYGQKTYNGVALLSRNEPEDVREGLPNFPDEQRRAVAASYGDTRVVNLYVPNGQAVGADKYRYKLAWLDALREHLAAELSRHPRIVVMGDFNIAPDDRDVYDPDAWRDRILCSNPERERLQALEALGFRDSFRLFDQPEASYSWWDYRAAAFRRKRGLRIDLILASADLASRCTASSIDPDPRKLERPSDHAPVFAEFG